MSPLFTAQDGRVVFDGQPLPEITRVRIKQALKSMGEKTSNVETLNRLDSVWMQLTRATVNANNQNRKAA
jgi:hypothetical protein